VSGGVFMLVAARDLRLAGRRRFEALLPVVFFIVAASLFPLGVGPEPQVLRQIAPGVVCRRADRRQQGEGYRIIFIHVPASWMSMFIYLVMAFWAAIGLAFNTRLSGMMAQALAPTGA
jgi:heme exporter protein C